MKTKTTAPELFPIKISNKNSKLGRIPNISLVPVKDCGNCASCKADCYALKAWRQYSRTRAAWKMNSKAFRNDPHEAVLQVSRQLDRMRTAPRFFRIHVAGDFLDQNHLDAWNDMVNCHPHTRFLAFTKMHNLNFSNLSDNLQVVLSMFPTMPLPNVYSGSREESPEATHARAALPKAWVTHDKTGNIEKRIPGTALECPGYCDTCGACWDLNKRNYDVFFHNH